MAFYMFCASFDNISATLYIVVVDVISNTLHINYIVAFGVFRVTNQ